MGEIGKLRARLQHLQDVRAAHDSDDLTVGDHGS
jgi:hypothetical protein